MDRPSRVWCFTINQRDGEEEPLVPMWDEETMAYMCYQKEMAPTTGTVHLQGVVKTKKPTRMPGLKKILRVPHAHVEICRDVAASVKYCQKTETRIPGTEPVIKGELKTPGQRSDLEVLAEAVLGSRKRTLAELARELPGPMLKHYKNVQGMRSVLFPACAMARTCVLLWGATGTGKTRYVYDNYYDEDIYSVFDIKNPWFDGYDGQQVVLFDECGPQMMHYDRMKRFTDRYPVQVPVKGGCVNWNAKLIFLTSNIHMSGWWKDMNHSDYEAMERRVKIFRIPDEVDELDEYLETCCPTLRKARREEQPSSVDMLLNATWTV